MDLLKLEFIADFRAGITFTPVRGVGWGPWECWLNCRQGDLPNGTIGLVPTGDWLCWNGDQQFGFADPRQAEMFCVYNNGPDERTRIVNPFTGDRASELRFEDVAPNIEAELERLQTPTSAQNAEV